MQSPQSKRAAALRQMFFNTTLIQRYRDRIIALTSFDPAPTLFDRAPGYTAIYNVAFSVGCVRTASFDSTQAQMQFRQFDDDYNASLIRRAAEAVYPRFPEIVLTALLWHLDTLAESVSLSRICSSAERGQWNTITRESSELGLKYRAERGGEGPASKIHFVVPTPDLLNMLSLLQIRAARMASWIEDFLISKENCVSSEMDVQRVCAKLQHYPTMTERAYIKSQRVIDGYMRRLEIAVHPWLTSDRPPKGMAGQSDESRYWYVHGLPESLKKLARTLEQFGEKVDAHKLAQKEYLGVDPSRLVSRLRRPVWKEWVIKFIDREEHGFWRLRTVEEISGPHQEVTVPAPRPDLR